MKKCIIVIMKKVLIPILIVIAFGCKQNTEQSQSYAEPDEESSSQSIQSAMVDFTPSDTSQYYLLEAPCAVVLFPDSVSLAKEQKTMTEEEWGTIMDDYSYYTMMATDTLRQSNVKVYTDLTGKRYLLFRGKNSSYTFDNQQLKGAWGWILFNGIDAPAEWDGTDYTALDSIYRR